MRQDAHMARAVPRLDHRETRVKTLEVLTNFAYEAVMKRDLGVARSDLVERVGGSLPQLHKSGEVALMRPMYGRRTHAKFRGSSPKLTCSPSPGKSTRQRPSINMKMLTPWTCFRTSQLQILTSEGPYAALRPLDTIEHTSDSAVFGIEPECFPEFLDSLLLTAALKEQIA